MSALFDRWPWNLPPGLTFFYIYVATGAALLVVVSLAQRAILEAITRARVAKLRPATSSATGAGVARAVERLGPGVLPRGTDVWRVAYLRHGLDGLVASLLSAAMAEGWLTPTSDSARRYHASPSDRTLRDPFMRELATSLSSGGPHSPKELRERAARVARNHEREILDDLANHGLASGALAELALQALGLCGGAIVIAAGVMRWWVRHELYGDTAPPALFLSAAMLVFLVAAAYVAFRTQRPAAAVVYLRWLEDATSSLRADVRSGRREEPFDVALTAAVDGVGGLAAVALLAPLAADLRPPPSVGSSSSCSSSSSSCSSSSSSCGGGGGCGGGCGGGGGCS